MIEINLESYKDLLYKSKNDPAIDELLKLLGDDFRISKFSDVYYHVYENLGIEVIFTKENYLNRFVIHNISQESIKIILPYGLDLSFKMKDVERILGIPERSVAGTQNMNCWVGYPEYGMGIDYLSKNGQDTEAGIEKIAIYYPETDNSRIKYHNKSEIFIYFQVRSSFYSPELIGELLQLEPNRVDVEDSNLFEILLTENPYLSAKVQLTNVVGFLEKNKEKIKKITHVTQVQLKIGVFSHLSNALTFKVNPEQMKAIIELGITMEFEFIT